MIDTYYTLGRSGLRVSRLALGAMTFGEDWGWGAEENVARDLFNAYVDAGGNFIDTADVYVGGKSEIMLGRFVAERKLRDRIVISTKFSFNGMGGNPNGGGNSRKNIMRAVEGSLQRLGTDYIDLYILHMWDRFTEAEEMMRSLDDLVRAGKVRHVGLSNPPAWYASRAQAIAEWRGYEPICALQMEYSLMQREIEREFIPFGMRYGAGVMVWSPLAGGLLSGKYRASANGPEGEGRLQLKTDPNHPGGRKVNDAQAKTLAELQNAAEALGKSMAEVALNWVANRPGVASVIVGATKLAQLQSNLSALDFQIPEELMQRLTAASELDLGYPYRSFTPPMQKLLSGGAHVMDKPPNYYGE